MAVARTCRRVEMVLWDYAAGRLSQTGTSVVRRHIASCPFCARSAAEYATTVRLLAAAAAEDLPAPQNSWPAIRLHIESTEARHTGQPHGARGRTAIYAQVALVAALALLQAVHAFHTGSADSAAVRPTPDAPPVAKPVRPAIAGQIARAVRPAPPVEMAKANAGQAQRRLHTIGWRESRSLRPLRWRQPAWRRWQHRAMGRWEIRLEAASRGAEQRQSCRCVPSSGAASCWTTETVQVRAENIVALGLVAASDPDDDTLVLVPVAMQMPLQTAEAIQQDMQTY